MVVGVVVVGVVGIVVGVVVDFVVGVVYMVVVDDVVIVGDGVVLFLQSLKLGADGPPINLQ